MKARDIKLLFCFLLLTSSLGCGFKHEKLPAQEPTNNSDRPAHPVAPSPSATPSPLPPSSVKVTAVSPASGSSGGGATLTITGEGFVAGATVMLGDSPCDQVTVQSATSLTCVESGQDNLGPATLLVKIPDGEAGELAKAYTYEIRPTFSSLNRSVFQPQCKGCHSGTKPRGKVDLSDYAHIVAPQAPLKSAITPGGHASSAIYTEVETGDMPDGGTPLSEDVCKAIADWIDAKAQDN